MEKRKPPNAGKGRKAGSQNVFTKTIKMAILGSFMRGGGEDWLLQLMKDDPKTYAALLGRVIPTEVHGPGEDGEHKATFTLRW